MMCEQGKSRARLFARGNVKVSRKMNALRIVPMISRTFRGPLFGVMAALAFSSAQTAIHPVVAQAQAQASQVGVVDDYELNFSFKKYAEAMTALEKRAKDATDKMTARDYLTPAEIKTFDEAMLKSVAATATANPALDALVTTGKERSAKYHALAGKDGRTAADTTELTTFQGYATANKASGSALQDQLSQLLNQQGEETVKKYSDQVNEVIKQVANDRKFVMIISKKSVIYSSDAVDVTAEVIKRLNNK